VIREALARGADRAIHVEDAALASADAFVVADALAAAMKDERFDLILTGLQSDDQGFAQTGVILAERLDLPHATIIMEQPEIHLHPAVQSQLADLFIETIRSREGGVDRHVQLVVETHSEHLLRRLQRRIAEGGLKPAEVAMYFCESGDQGSILRPLEVDVLGNIHNWPRDFFGDQMEDIARQAEVSLRKRAETAGNGTKTAKR